MRRFASLLVLSLCPAAAFAADLPTRKVAPAVPVVAPAFSWTGFYLGAGLGWVQTRTDYTAGAAVPGATFVAVLPTVEKNGVIGSLFAGYNYQVDRFVIGAEIDGSGLITGKSRYASAVGDYITAHTNWTGSIRLRAGYAMDRMLLYVTGGAAFAAADSTVTGTGYSFGAGDSARTGWTLGAGAEYAITDHWIAGAEYRYAQYGSDSYTYPVGFRNLGIVGFKQQVDTNQVQARVSYKF